jgi:hypothetical protein
MNKRVNPRESDSVFVADQAAQRHPYRPLLHMIFSRNFKALPRQFGRPNRPFGNWGKTVTQEPAKLPKTR